MRLLLLMLPLVLQDDPDKRGPGKTVTVDRAVDDIAHRCRTVAARSIALAWVIDVSPSLADDRAAISKRIDRTFADMPRDKTLRMAVFEFSKGCRKILGLSGDRDRVRKAIARAHNKGRGIENGFSALQEAAREIHGEGGWRAVVLVTDEAGDDRDRIESTLTRMKDEGIVVFVIGRESAFEWVHDFERDDSGWYIPVASGFESAGQEVAQRSPFCCNQPEYPHCRRRLSDPEARNRVEWFQWNNPLWCDYGPGDRVRSGFGPYGQSRLAAETRGEFYIIGSKASYERKAMIGYEPELCTVEEWRKRNGRSPMRTSIMKMFDRKIKAKTFGLKALLTKADVPAMIRKAKETDKELRRWIEILLDGRKEEGEPTGEGARYRRWYANHDLAVAQVRRLRHHVEQYRLLMEDLASGRTKMRGQMQLVGGPVRGEAALREEARRALERVSAEHPGTPWDRSARLLAAEMYGFDVRPVPPKDIRPGPGDPPPPPSEK